MHDLAFTCMGCEMRLLADGPDDAAVGAARELLDALDARLSRFRPESELARLNADPRETVPASPLLRVAVAAAVWAAERTGGLVDPTLLGDLLAAGYTESLGAGPRAPLAEALAGASLAEALAGAPPRRAARPRADARWRAVRIDDAAGTIARPSGLLLDTGGTTKGLAADAAARLLGDARRLVVDCGGDLRLAVGPGAPAFDVAVEHPLGGDRAATLRLRGGGVATSGLGRRIWRGPDGRPAHHVLDPSTGAPAWTGLVAATAVAPTTLAAEALAKAALLSGAAGARRLLARRGGVLVHDDGTVERVGPRRVVAADERPRRAGAPVRVVAADERPRRAGAPVRVVAADERPRRAGAPVRVVAADERPRRAGAPVRVVAADERPLGALARLRIAAVPARPTGAAA